MMPDVTTAGDAGERTDTPSASTGLRLRWAVGLIFVLVLGVGILGIFVAAEAILMSGFREVERRETERNVRRAQAALARCIESLSVKAADWGAWDDTCRFIADRNEAYVESNLTPESLVNLNVDALLFFDVQGSLVMGRSLDEDEQPTLPDPALVAALTRSGMLRHASPEDRQQGVLRVADQLVLAASRPIVTSANEGPVRGSVVFVRRLSSDAVQELSQQTELGIGVFVLGAPDMPADCQRVLEELLSMDEGATPVYGAGPEAIRGYARVSEARGEPVAVLRIQTGREVYAQGRVSVRWLMASLILLGVLVTAAILVLVDRVVISRLERMSAHVARIGSGEVGTQLPEGGVRELGVLSESINRMVRTITAASHQLALRAEELKAQSEQLEHSRAVADAANRAKTEFLANMSHEIRTPMTSVLGYTEMLLEPGLGDEERHQYVRLVHRAGTSLLAIINDILDISKIEAGRLDVEHVPVSPGAIVTEVMAMLRGRAESKGLAFSAACTSPIPLTITSDPVRLRQVLVNITGNAIKFTDRGEVRVNVGMRRSDAGYDKIVFEVRDTGPGITPEQMERLFKPFEQADSSTTRRFGGTGLGLHISKRLAEALGGTIQVESRPGEGCSFCVTIDPGSLEGAWWTEQLGGELRTDDPSHSAPLAALTPLRGRVLVADDSPDNRRLVSHILRRAGAEVELAEHGAEVLEKVGAAAAAGKPFGLVLLDMNMPVMDGYEAASRLRAMGVRTPVVALTAQAFEGESDRCIAAGCDAFASKPIDRAALLRVCAHWLELAESANRSAA